MKRFFITATLLCLLAAAMSPAMHAQEQPTTIVMATYYKCTQGDEPRADAIFQQHEAPFWKKEQAAGRITAFGWMKHVQGGEWRRLAYFAGTDMDKMLDVRATISKMLTAPEHKELAELARICPNHDDYIWRALASSRPMTAIGGDRSPFGLSTYYACNANEAEADAIVKMAFAPVLNQRVKDKMIDSWTWQEHLLGGKYRRILVLDGASEKALMKNWTTLPQALEKAAPDLSRRFFQICHDHTDYIWEITPQ
jgi:hypothetical protein